ncbi:MAG: HPr kinase/phosphorylase [Chlamydiae bacterium]|nr:HPr kinase/phosphorylase [Chlamydiota bacterium]
MYTNKDLYDSYREILGLESLTGELGLLRPIRLPEVHRPGLSLSGYLKDYANQRILVFGNSEISYIKDLDKETRQHRLSAILTDQTPLVVVAGRSMAPKELLQSCRALHIPVFRSSLKTMELQSRLTYLLLENFSPTTTCHGTLVEAFGVGVMIQGDSSVGKSEAALSLIERGHRLITDDVVKVKLREGSYLEGSGAELTRHLMEIRGIGIINVAHLYGAVCVRDDKRIDMVIKLEVWDDKKFYDRVGLDEKFIDLLGIKIPYHVIPVKPGRDIALLIETIVLNHRLKEMGYNSAKDFNIKLLETIARKQNSRKGASENL